MKRVISLDGIWKLSWFEFGHTEGQFREDYDDSTWLDAPVPGEVHEVLLRHGLIEDPFFGLNNEKREWVERVDWWYRRRFFVPRDIKGMRVKLVFEGLDTFATIWLNGNKIGTSEDMFVPLVIDVTDKLRYGDWNIIAVRLGAPWYETIKRAGDFSEQNLLWNGNYARLYARKAQYQYGWDWAPKLLTVGIWRSVKLVAYDKAMITDVYVKTLSVEGNKAILEFEVEIESNRQYEAELVAEGVCHDSKFEHTARCLIKKGLNVITFRTSVENAKLWWPVGYGPQNLYNLRVRLLINGEVVDEHTTRFGIRTVELITESPEAPNGKVFYFKINGVKIFAKGANWIPADLLISRLSKERYRELLQMVVEGNHNMLRVWGGGLVEYDEFYDLCDELGIMIWHDFQFACGHYPEDKRFLELVRKEVAAIVKRLRNHPSIVLWCGNNENEMFDYYSGYGVTKPKIDFEVIPSVLKEVDPSRPYWPSSPWGGKHPNDPEEGDRHNWDVYHGLQPIESYLKDPARFLSEFGMQAAPHIKTLRKFIPASKLWPISDHWLYHYHMPERVLPYIVEFGDPRDLYSYILLSQLAQAMALKTAIEHCRRRKFICGGALYWSLNAPWPNICWETIDYYGRPKMGYYFAKRAYAPVLVSPLLKEGKVEVWLVNDTLKDISGILSIKAVDLTNGSTMKEIQIKVSINENSSKKVAEVELKQLKVEDPTRSAIFLEFRYDGGLSKNYLFLTKHRDLKFGRSKLDVKVKKALRKDDDVIIEAEVKSHGYSHLIFIDVLEDYVAIADDNFFELLDGESRTVKVRVRRVKEDGLTLIVGAYNAEIVKKHIEVRTN